MDLVSIFTKGLGDYSPDAYSWVTNIVTNATTTVGIYLAGILLLLEVASIYERANTSNDGRVTLKMFQNIAWRAALSGVMIALSRKLAEFLVLIGIGLVNLINDNADKALNLNLPTIKAGDDLISTLGGLASLIVNPNKALAAGVAFIIGLLVAIISYLMIAVIILMRFMQLYIMIALSPIPMASFASKEYQNIGITYIKRMFAYALQPAVILVVMGVYHFISAVTVDFGDAVGILTGESAIISILKQIAMGIVFIITLWQSQRLASNLVGA